MKSRWGFLLLALACSVPLTGQQAEQSFLGSEACQACHPDVWQTFPRNPHFHSVAVEGQPPATAGCEGCHGPGGLHVAGAGDKTKIVLFPALEPAAVLDNCLTCHSKDFGKMEIRRSSHSTGEVSCVSCHTIHGRDDQRALLAKRQAETCYTCHIEVRAQFELPFKHRVNEGAIECSDCHNPHGAPTATWAVAHSPMVRQAFGNDIACTNCHTDKRGPFIHEHAPVRVEGCTACHLPHGSTNARLLTRPAAFTLCLECHNGVMAESGDGFGLRGQGIPNPTQGFHNLADPRFQNCVTCHARIHGSNADPLLRR